MNPEAIKELMVKLGFDYDGSGGDDFLKQASGIKNALFKVVGTIAGAVGATSAFTLATTASKDAQIKNAQALQLSQKEMQAYQDAAEKAGMGQDTLLQKLGYFKRELGKIGTNKQSQLLTDLAESRLNISPFNADNSLKKAPQLLNEIVAGISKIKDENRRVGLMESLLGDFTVWKNFVDNGGKDFKKSMQFMNDIDFGISKSEMKSLDEFKSTWVDIKTIIQDITDDLMNIGVKTLTPFMKEFKEWYVEIQKLQKLLEVKPEEAKKQLKESVKEKLDPSLNKQAEDNLWQSNKMIEFFNWFNEKIGVDRRIGGTTQQQPASNQNITINITGTDSKQIAVDVKNSLKNIRVQSAEQGGR